MISVKFSEKVDNPCVPGLVQDIEGGTFHFNEDDVPGMTVDKSLVYAVAYAAILMQENPNMANVQPEKLVISTQIY